MNDRALGHRFVEVNYRKLSPGEALVICPHCGEDNADNFRYCGMCGTLLEAPRPISVQKAIAAAEAARKGGTVAAEAPRPAAVANPTSVPKPAAPVSTPTIGGPSLLGLDQSVSTREDAGLPSMDSLRDRSFSGLDSFLEPEESRGGGRRVLLLLVLLAAIGAAGWWAYSNYVGAMGARGRQSASATPAPNTTANNPSTPSPIPESSSPSETSSTTAPTAAAPVPETPQPAATATAPAPTNTLPKVAEPKPSQSIPHESKQVATPKPAPPQKVAREETKPAPAPATQPAPPAEDNGDAAFRKGEAYLYGRGVPENCEEAIKYLKDASAQRNAKARSTFGTMYATGHCVPRDFPTSYSWFAQALHVDPNNQILERDLTAVWNQMTPPERQMATKLSQ